MHRFAARFEHFRACRRSHCRLLTRAVQHGLRNRDRGVRMLAPLRSEEEYNQTRRMHSPIRFYVAAAMLFASPLAGQWRNIPSKGKVNLAAPAPKGKDGHPDLSGIWEPNANKYVRDIAADLKPE